MKIFKSASVDFLNDKILFLDNNSLIAIINNEQVFKPFLKDLDDCRCVLATIPSVVFEFTRTDNVDGYNKRKRFIKSIIGLIFPIEKYIDKFSDLILILQRIKGNISYSDFLLYCCIYNFLGNGFLLTENHHDFSTALLNRKLLFTTDDEKETIRNIAIYEFDRSKYDKAAENILHGNKIIKSFDK